MMLTKPRIFFVLVLIGAAAFMQYDVGKKSKVHNEKIEMARQIAEQEKIAREVAAEKDAASPESRAKFAALFKQEAAEIGRIQNDPEAAIARMKKMAQAMGPEDVKQLADIIADEEQNGDERALAVELLSIKNNTASLVALQNFVATTNKVEKIKQQYKKEFETVLRAQAVESIAAYPEKQIALSTLTYLQSRVDNRFISERISRASASLMYGNESQTLREQDDEALKKLVE